MILFASVETAVASFLEQHPFCSPQPTPRPPREEDGLSEWGSNEIWATSSSISDRMPIFQALVEATLALVSGQPSSHCFSAQNRRGARPRMPKAQARYQLLGPPRRGWRDRKGFKGGPRLMKPSGSQWGIKVRRTKHCGRVDETVGLESPSPQAHSLPGWPWAGSVTSEFPHLSREPKLGNQMHVDRMFN